LLDLVAAPVVTRPPARIAAVGVLHRMGDEAVARSIAALIPLVDARGASVRREAIECLATLGPRARDAVPALERALADEDRLVRCLAALALSDIEGWGKGRARSMLSREAESPALSAAMRQQVRWVLGANLVAGSEISQPVHILRSLVADLRRAEAVARLNTTLPAEPGAPGPK
jgi:HEAT repeat protein